MIKDSIYIETTVVSYYTSMPSRDIIVLAIRRLHGNGGLRLLNVTKFILQGLLLRRLKQGTQKLLKEDWRNWRVFLFWN